MESFSDDALSLLDVRLDAGWTGAPLVGESELRLEEDPVMTFSLDSKKKSASSWCFG